MGRIVSLVVMLLLFVASVFLLWREEYGNYRVMDNEDGLRAQWISEFSESYDAGGDRPLLVHFYDHDCSYAQVNLEHVKLVFDTVSTFDVLIIAKGVDADRFPIDSSDHVKLFFDVDGSIFDKSGVTLSPVAIVWGMNEELVYQGNYTNGAVMCGIDNITSADPFVAIKALVNSDNIPYFLEIPSFSCKI